MNRSPKAWQAELSEQLPMSSKPMLGGMGRAIRIRAAMDALTLSDRKLVLEALDEIMRPMTARELDQALLRAGTTRSDRIKLVKAMKPFSILMVAA